MWTFRGLATDLLVGFSLINLLLLNVWRLLFDGDTPMAFYRTLSRNDLLAALLCTFVGGGTVAAGVFFVRRFRRLWLIDAARCVFIATALLVANVAKRFLDVQPVAFRFPRFASPVSASVFAALLSVVAILVVAATWASRRRIAAGYASALLCVSPFVAVTAGRAAWLMATLSFGTFRDLPRAPAAHMAPAHNRVVLLIFDELDYGVAFGARAPGLSLPAFDRLRADGVSLDGVQSPARNTSESIPSYLFGEPVIRLIPLGPRRFDLRLRNGRTVDADSLTSFIEQAGQEGYRTGVVGFFFPYCRLRLARAAERCVWEPFVTDAILSAAPPSILDATSRQVRSLNPLNNHSAHLRRLAELVDAAKELAADPGLDLVYLHLPIPHPPALGGRFPWLNGPSGYVRNVAIADEMLGDIRLAMERSGTWASSIVVVTSDHGWRMNPARASDDTRRVPFLIKSNGVAVSQRDATPLSSLHLGRLMIALLHGTAGMDVHGAALASFKSREERVVDQALGDVPPPGRSR